MLSCSDNDQKESQKDSSAQSSGSGETETELTYLDEVPETATFDGYTVRYTGARDRGSIYVDLEDEEATDITDIVVESVWRRNNIVQDRLDVKIQYEEEIHRDDFNKTVMNSLNASSDDYDVFVGHQRFQVELAAQGYMKNLSNANYLDLTKPYWATDYIENLSYKDISYWITGDMVNGFISNAWVFFVNATRWNMSYSDQDIYSIVKDGKWTMDKLSELTQNQYTDMNGDGKKDGEDRYGMLLEPGIRVTAMMFSSDVPYSEKDSDGVPQLVVQNEHSYDAFAKLQDFIYKNENVLDEEPNDIEDTDMFVQDKTLFLIDALSTLESNTMREMDSDYFVIPVPKYDENQENYITTHYDGIPVIGIPITVSFDHIDAITATLEVTSSVSHEISLPAYYDSALKNKYSRDAGQAEMIDIIHDTITGDFAHIYGDVVGKFFSLYSFWGDTIMRDGISSMLQKNMKLWENDLEALLEAFEENVDN